MNKTAIKNFAIWARNKLIADITYKAGLLGITEKGIKSALPQSTKDVQFFDIGTKEPYSISDIEIKQREKLAETINNKAKQSDFGTTYKAVIEEVAYTWFNRLIAVRFMEVNDYLTSRIRVLSSESDTKIEPDLVTTPFNTDFGFSPYEKDRIVQLTHENLLDELFQMLFIKQCNALNAILPNLFEKTNDYTELLLNVSFTDKDGVVYHLVHDIPEMDFKIRTGADEEAIILGKMTEEEAPRGQVEIIGWLYQYYNTEPKDEVFALLKKNVKITKERIPAATQLFTPDWIVRYMVENSLGRLWLEHERATSGVSAEYLNGSYFGWKYYLEEAEQEPEVEAQLAKIREEYKTIKPEDIKVIDPCMGSGHIVVYAFDVLMQIYESCGYSQRDAAKSILVHNVYGLDIDNRAYQLAYFALMMKARQYNRRILDGETDCHVYSIQESNGVNREHLKYFGTGMSDIERNIALPQLKGLLDTFIDAKEYGSILNVENYNWELLYRFVGNVEMRGQLSLDTMGIEDTREQLRTLVEIGATMAQKYDVVVTNPPYMGSSGMGPKLTEFVKQNYPQSKADLFAVFIQKNHKTIKTTGYLAMITQHVWMFKTAYSEFRQYMLSNLVVNMAHLGAKAFEEIGGEVVQTTAFICSGIKIKGYMSTYVRLVDYYSQYSKEANLLNIQNRFFAKQDNFSNIAETIYAYWISKTVFTILANSRTLKDVAAPRKGLTTGDNEKFVRIWHEISSAKFSVFSDNSKWFQMTKGGNYRKWYGNNEYVIDWSNDGYALKNFIDENGKLRSVLRNTQYYFKECISWNDTASGNIAFRFQPKGYIPNASGPCVYATNSMLMYIIALLNSKISNSFLEVLAPSLKFEVGQVSSFPVILRDDQQICISANSCIVAAKSDWDSFEPSWDFVKHPLVQLVSGVKKKDSRIITRIEVAFKEWDSNRTALFNQQKANEEELNRIFIEIYGLQDELTTEVDEKDITIHKADLGRDIHSFISYAVGCMFGRYSLDIEGLAYAGGMWDDSKYSTFIPDKDNILPITDEEYFGDDIVGLLVTFIKKVYGAETLEQNLDFIAKALRNKGNTSREIIRNYFLKDFYKDHCKIYQKRPIYWLFDSGKADGFKALIYMHRYDENTIGNLRIDYLHRMQRIYESEIARMQETIENSTNAREVTTAEKRKEKLTKQLKETKEYDAKIAHLALARIVIDLDDGVLVNYEKVQTGTAGKMLEVLAKI